MDSRYIRKMKCTRLVLLLVFLTLLCTTDLVLAQRISKKILTEGEGKFNAPITVGKGMPFSITFNEIEIPADIVEEARKYRGELLEAVAEFDESETLMEKYSSEDHFDMDVLFLTLILIMHFIAILSPPKKSPKIRCTS